MKNWEEHLKSALTALHFENTLIEDMITSGRPLSLKTGKTVVGPKSKISEVPLLLNGLLKVMRVDTSGEERILYYVETGQTCVMTASICVENRIDQIRIETEASSDMWMLPAYKIDPWMGEFQSFRKFILDSYDKRMDELLHVIDSITFQDLSARIKNYLYDMKQATGDYIIHKTHEEIAKDLHTGRVVISRLLKRMEKEGMIEQYRNRIEIL